MKHINKFFFVVIALLSFLSYSKLEAQSGAAIPYNVINNTNCPITFDWSVTKVTSCTSPCDFGTGITIAGGSGYTISSFGTGGSCSPNDAEGCAITITITKIGAVSTSIVASSAGPAGPQLVGNVSPGCTAASTNYVCTGITFSIQN